MAIISQITARPVFGFNPIGYTPLQPATTAYIHSNVMNIEIDYADLTFVPADIPATQANFLDLVQDYFDTTYLPTVFTDATKTYTADIVINSIRLDFTTGVTDRGIWTERTYKYFVGVTVAVAVA